jgi:hypothetical protein
MKLETYTTAKGNIYLKRDKVLLPDKFIQRMVTNSLVRLQMAREAKQNERQPERTDNSERDINNS